MGKITEKPWGYEELLSYTDKYAMKRMVINAGHRMSLQYHDIKEEKKRKRKRSRLCPHFHGSDGNQTLIWSLCPRHEPTYKTKGGVLGRMKHSSGTKRRNGVSRDGSLGKDSRFVCQGNVSLFLFLVVLRVLCD